MFTNFTYNVYATQYLVLAYDKFWYEESALRILRNSYKNKTVFLRMIFWNNSINKKHFLQAPKTVYSVLHESTGNCRFVYI